MNNEEKGTMYFVWEKTPRRGYQPAKYRELPKTGMGKHSDNKRFLRIVELTTREVNESFEELAKRYPCPPVPEDV